MVARCKGSMKGNENGRGGKAGLFISHAETDRQRHIQPLAEALANRKVSFWLDCLEMGLGHSIAISINKGLRESRYVLICLSKAFIDRKWPEVELNAALTMQTDSGTKKVLPLILNSKQLIIERYPLIGGLIYREYKNAGDIANHLATMVGKSDRSEYLLVVIESVHTGSISNLHVSPRASIHWLIEQAKCTAGVTDSLDTGGFQPYKIRWVLVDSKAERVWREMDELGETLGESNDIFR